MKGEKMNQLLQMQSEGKRELLVYHYQKIQDVDEVILQLLNEAGLDGFIKSSVDKSTLVINYDITGYKKVSLNLRTIKLSHSLSFIKIAIE